MAVLNTAIRGAQIQDAVAGAGLSKDASDNFQVNVDDSSIEISADTLQVAPSGITETHLNTSVAGDGLSGGEGTPLAVNVDTTSIEIDSDTLRVVPSGINSTHIDQGDYYDYRTPGGSIDVATPSGDWNAANKSYVDSVAQGLDPKDSCIAIEASGNLALSGTAATPDGVSLSAGDRVLLNAQTDAKENGIWVVAAGAWTRPTDFAVGDDAAGAFTFITQGNIYADTGWVCTTDEPNDIIGTDDLAFSQFSGAGQITAGAGLTKTGDQLDVGENAAGAIKANADDLQLQINSSTLQITGAAPGTLDVKASGITNSMLFGAISDDKLVEDYIKTTEVDNSTIEFTTSTLNVVASGITTTEIADDAVEEWQINIGNTAQDGYVLSWNQTLGQMEWSAGVSPSGVTESDIAMDNFTGTPNGATTIFTLTSQPVANSVQVYLNGLYQEEGAGNDYVLNALAKTLTFTVAPLTGDLLIAHYIIDN
jgi:hypothetical protein